MGVECWGGSWEVFAEAEEFAWGGGVLGCGLVCGGRREFRKMRLLLVKGGLRSFIIRSLLRDVGMQGESRWMVKRGIT